MMKRILFLTLTILSGCAADSHDPNAAVHEQRATAVPDLYSKPTQSQRGAIMSGERPDWRERDWH
ncbi:hypothetical protein [Pectobacterium cacticida]|uniref:hypothetical protein n=1 Tax=Pectobacterium cacticida TaxID=69221 RepID=UPI002FEEDD8D